MDELHLPVDGRIVGGRTPMFEAAPPASLRLREAHGTVRTTCFCASAAAAREREPERLVERVVHSSESGHDGRALLMQAGRDGTVLFGRAA